MENNDLPRIVKRFTIFAILFFFPSLTFAENLDSFRGVPFGASEAEAREKIPGLKCFDDSLNKVRQCWEMFFRIGEMTIGKPIMIFRNDKLVSANMEFTPATYQYLKDVFIKKYGNPSNIIEEMVKTKMGAEFKNERTQWHGERVFLEMWKYKDTLKRGMAIYVTVEGISTMKKENEKSKEKAIKDF